MGNTCKACGFEETESVKFRKIANGGAVERLTSADSFLTEIDMDSYLGMCPKCFTVRVLNVSSD
ncbi:hypothetical protein [Bacillus halotolerans]|uniref:hypothetical protein n=1 Tax=Bacillus halotolerans TaxID=260554 RepID=UPI0022807CA3|nr:hypothetical protein [Bacillus halotolerans]MCY8472426.1 hypothetical protein [Bacillus halotolerans]